MKRINDIQAWMGAAALCLSSCPSVIFKIKTASALEFHILSFAFRRNCPADFTLCNFFLFAAQRLYNGTFRLMFWKLYMMEENKR